jgi:hypothetical protein
MGRGKSGSGLVDSAKIWRLLYHGLFVVQPMFGKASQLSAQFLLYPPAQYEIVF